MLDSVLVIAFNRPDLLEIQFESLQNSGVKRIYVSIDGPRNSHPGDVRLVEQCRSLALDIDWAIEVHTLFHQDNLGCGKGVTSAIDWFFGHVERGIILEDDVIADPSFFPYMTAMLDLYESDPRVLGICGTNLVPNSELDANASYRFSSHPYVWGWATWRRAWEMNDLEITDWRKRLPFRKLWRLSGGTLFGYLYWRNNFNRVASGAIDTWDVQWMVTAWEIDGLFIVSNTNLVRNTGWREDATHTKTEIPAHVLAVSSFPANTVHPVTVEADQRADRWAMRNTFPTTVRSIASRVSRKIWTVAGRSNPRREAK
jgi:hypothetical protein